MAKSFGGSGFEYASSIKQTPDGGYIVAGSTQSYDGDVSGNHGGYDCWVLKLSSEGDVEWTKTLGGSKSDNANSVDVTSDGSYVVAGSTESNDGDVSGNHGSTDFWVVKLSSKGIIQWQKCFGGSGSENANSIQQTSDNGYIVSGYSSSDDGDVTGNHGEGDYWVVKLSSEGIIQWEKCLGGSAEDGSLSNSTNI
jgi:hypothetical protein